MRLVMRILAIGMLGFGLGTIDAMRRPIDVGALTFTTPAPAPAAGETTPVGQGPGHAPEPETQPESRPAPDQPAPAPESQPAAEPPGAGTPDQPAHEGDIGLAEAYEMFQNGAIFVDARSRAEYEAGHVQGAMNISLEAIARSDPSLAEKLDWLRAGFPIVIYCKGADCSDSHDLKRRLESVGITGAKVFTGGYPEWERAGYPVQRGPER